LQAAVTAPRRLRSEKEILFGTKFFGHACEENTMHIKLFTYIAALSILASCNNTAREQQKKAEEAQQTANAKIALASVEGQQKVDRAQQEANGKIAQANSVVQQEVLQAQQTANQDIRQAGDDFLKLRNDYQVDASKSVNELDNQVDRLKVIAQTAKPSAKVRFESMLPRVVTQQGIVRDELVELPKQTPQMFGGFKTKFDKDIVDLRKMIDEAAGKL
jgi:hypothetical protein